jgi:hypothetical protein
MTSAATLGAAKMTTPGRKLSQPRTLVAPLISPRSAPTTCSHEGIAGSFSPCAVTNACTRGHSFTLV